LSTGVEFKKDNEKGNIKHLFAIDYTHKDFAGEERDTGSQSQFKWKYNSLDAQKLDEFKFKFFAGSGDDGTEESENTFMGTDFDWFNKWEMGLKFDIGFGMEYRNYKNDVPISSQLGETRVDAPLRFSTGLGWEFPFNLELMYNYQYTFNLSNTTPYVRIIHGLFLSYEF
jgi:hypothetical protein